MITENRKFVLNILAIASIVYGVAMLPSIVLAVKYHEVGVYKAMIIIASFCFLLGSVMHRHLNNDLSNVKLRICYMTTIIVWIMLIVLSAIPYYTSAQHYSIVDSLFESTASWTTTGASAIDNSFLPVGLRMWRATCNWLGGIGIILLVISFLPQWQFVGQRLVSTEIRGPNFLMSTTTFRKAYRRIIIVYCALTIAQYIALRLAGFGQLDACVTTLSNSSTSGLQHINNGVIIGMSTPVKVILTVFAFLCSLNVGAVIVLISGRLKTLLRMTETKAYIIYIAVISIIMTIAILYTHQDMSFGYVFSTTLMQTVSFASTASYIVSDCWTWPTFCKSIIMIMMLIGSCALSTGGGIKISRFVIAAKTLRGSMFHIIHPSSVRTMKYNGKVCKQEDVLSANIYIAVFLVMYFVGAILISLEGTNVYESLSCSLAMLGNSGTPTVFLRNPGLFADMNGFSKLSMCFLMLCGRLEIYPVLLLFSRKFWNTKYDD